MTSAQFFVGLALTISLCTAAPVYPLSDSNMTDFLTSVPLVMVKFYAPWCSACHRMANDYILAANQLTEEEEGKMAFAEFDVTANTAGQAEHGIVNLPTLKMFVRGQDFHRDYHGDHDSESFLEYMRTFTVMSSNLLASELEKHGFAHKVCNRGKVFIVLEARGPSQQHFEESHVYLAYAEVASKYSNVDFVKFGHRFEEGDESYEIEVFSPLFLGGHHSKKFPVAPGTNYFEDIHGIVLRESIPRIGIYNDDSKDIFDFHEKPKFVYFSSTKGCDFRPSQLRYFENRLAKIAPRFPSLIFVIMDQGWYQDKLLSLGFGVRHLPTQSVMGIFEPSGRRYRYDGNSTEFDVDAIEAFLGRYMEGSVPAYVKSQEPLVESIEPKRGHVLELVGSQVEGFFRDYARAAEVVLLAYAPHDIISKELVTVFERLADEFQEHVFVKINARENELVSGLTPASLPAIMYLPAEGNQFPMFQPREFDQQGKTRNIDNLRSFIRHRGVSP